MSLSRLSWLAWLLACIAATPPSPLSAADTDLASQLRTLDAALLAGADKANPPGQMLSADVRGRIRAANERESKLWHQIKTKDDWEAYRDVRLEALRRSLGQFPEPAKDMKVTVTRTIDGDGYRIENIVFESRPGLLVTANLYAPRDPPRSMPGVIICPSHHNPKTQGELQDMGMSWARLGCLVLVMDSLGHGERRQHPFIDANSYPGMFRVGRQDYYFRYNTSLQLYALGDSLMGWMVWDLRRGVDLLLSRPGIDRERILLLGAVAGGGDPAAVAGALDPRITAVGPFNFGGPQPETTYPLPADAETSFNYAGGGSWESTRNLRLSARDGFLPWLIVGGVAPRRLIYGHEFSWDRERDPVWKRLERIFEFYKVPDRLAPAHGKGLLSGKPPQASHCNNIGPEHRETMYPALNRWFALNGSTNKEYRIRHKPEELLCLTGDAKFEPKPMYEVASELGRERVRRGRDRLAKQPPDMRLEQARKDWAALLGDVEPRAVKATPQETKPLGKVKVERLLLEVEPGIVAPTLLLLPANGGKSPVVVTFAQEGKQEFLKKRAEGIARLLDSGTAVCLPDLRGTGETKSGDSRDRQSSATSISAGEFMLGQTLVGARLRDLRSVLRYLRGRTDLDAGHLALWGDSFAVVNAGGQRLNVPLDAEKMPNQSEPLGELLALFGALYEPEVKAVYAQGGLIGYQSLLQGYFYYLPHDAVIPGALTLGDLGDVTALLAPRPVRLEGLVDAQNRKAGSEALAKAFEPASAAYRGAPDRFLARSEAAGGDQVADWLLAQLKGK